MHWKRWLWATVKRSGFELNRARPDIASFLRSRDVRTVLDAGANIGQYGRYLRGIGYKGQIVSFEPVGEVFRRLKQRADRDGKWAAHQVGLGAQDGEATINVAANPVYSSILDVRDAARAFDERASALTSERIAIHTLHRYVAAAGATPIFLKVDTQGFERQVLAGCDLSDPRIVGVQLELPVIHLYEDTWSISEAIDFMAGEGFVIAQVDPVNYHREDPDAVVEIDCVFRRKSRLDS